MSVCVYCGRRLPLLHRVLGTARFCSKQHLELHQQEVESLALEALSRLRSGAEIKAAPRETLGASGPVVQPLPPVKPKLAPEPPAPALQDLINDSLEPLPLASIGTTAIDPVPIFARRVRMSGSGLGLAHSGVTGTAMARLSDPQPLPPQGSSLNAAGPTTPAYSWIVPTVAPVALAELSLRHLSEQAAIAPAPMAPRAPAVLPVGQSALSIEQSAAAAIPVFVPSHAKASGLRFEDSLIELSLPESAAAVSGSAFHSVASSPIESAASSLLPACPAFERPEPSISDVAELMPAAEVKPLPIMGGLKSGCDAGHAITAPDGIEATCAIPVFSTRGAATPALASGGLLAIGASGPAGAQVLSHSGLIASLSTEPVSSEPASSESAPLIPKLRLSRTAANIPPVTLGEPQEAVFHGRHIAVRIPLMFNGLLQDAQQLPLQREDSHTSPSFLSTFAARPVQEAWAECLVQPRPLAVRRGHGGSETVFAPRITMLPLRPSYAFGPLPTARTEGAPRVSGGATVIPFRSDEKPQSGVIPTARVTARK